MNRFRRKSESHRKRKEAKEAGASSTTGASDASGSPTSPVGPGGFADSLPELSLPESNFRTSLILPHLTKRFSLLRDGNGQLVDIATMQNHLAAQRQTGRLTAYEVDAVLAQYRLQTLQEQDEPPARPPVPRLPRRDWSQTVTSTGAVADEQEETATTRTNSSAEDGPTTRESFMSSTPSSPDQQLSNPFHSHVNTGYNSSTFGRASSTTSSFLHSPGVESNASFSPSSTSNASFGQQQYRRGGNSMFGGRVQTIAQMKMSKSSSSLASSAGGGSMKKSGSTRTLGAEEDETGVVDEVVDAIKSEDPTEEIDVVATDSPAMEGEEEMLSEEEEEGDSTLDSSDPNRLSSPPVLNDTQLRRISNALDDIETELSKTFMRLRTAGDDEEEDTTAEHDRSVNDTDEVNPSTTSTVASASLASPAISDTEPMDPFYHSLAPSSGSPVSTRPISTVSTASTTLEYAAGGSSGHSSLAFPMSVPSSPEVERTEPRPTFADDLPKSPSPAPAFDDSRDADTPIPPTPIPFRDPRSREVSNASTVTATDFAPSPLSPQSYTFPHVPTRANEGDTSLSDGDPFDLSFRSTGDEGEGSEVLGRGGVPRSKRGYISTSTSTGPGGSIFSPEIGNASTSSLGSVGAQEEEKEMERVEEGEEDVVDVSPSSPVVPLSLGTTTDAPILDTAGPIDLDISPTITTTTSSQDQRAVSPVSLRRPQDEQDSDFLHVSPSTSRRPSTDRSESTPSPSPSAFGEADLALEDLLLIQETLVRSASRRAAARKLGGTTPASTSPSDLDVDARKPSLESDETPSAPPGLRGLDSLVRSASRRAAARKLGAATPSPAPSDFGHRGSDSRKASLETDELPDIPGGRRTSASASEGRRGSESDAVGTTSESERRGSGSERRGSGSDRRGSGSENGRRSASLGVPGGRRRRSEDTNDQTYRFTTATGTSVAGSSPLTNSVPTPSTAQSDAFEFSSLVGSPESAEWEEAKEHLMSPSQEADEYEEHEDDGEDERSPQLDDAPSPQPDQNLEASLASFNDASDDNDGEADDVVEDLKSDAPVAFGAPVELESEAPLRVPRGGRDPKNTQSMLIRDVRNQATLATIALKKQGPTSPPTRSISRAKSIRKGSISQPQLVSQPSHIPSVPILNPDVPSPTSPKVKRSGSRATRAEADGSKSKGIGLRFKMLLKKQSSDRLQHLNGDEVTPFVDTEAPGNSSPVSSPPFTPPTQSTSNFSTPEYADSPQYPITPSNDPCSLDYQRSPPTNLAAVDESGERGSPSGASVSSGSRSLTRLVSRLRGGPNRSRRESETSLATDRSHSSTPDPSTLLGSPLARVKSESESARRPSIDQQQESFGLGVALNGDSSRAPISYDIGAGRSRRFGSEASSGGTSNEYASMPQTAPLATSQRSTADTSLQYSNFSFPPALAPRSAPPLHRPGSRGSQTRPRHHHTNSTASIDSMKKLWEAAEDLGLPPDKVQELVDLSYAQSPSTSTGSHAHSGSTSSTIGRRSEDGDVTMRQQQHQHQHSITSMANSAGHGHGRGMSDSSFLNGSNTNGGTRRRANSNASTSRSIHDRVPTPPPSTRDHRRHASIDSRVSRAGPVPPVPTGLRINPEISNKRQSSRLSVARLRPKTSPTDDRPNSFRSSEYAGSVFDLYGGSEEGSQSERDAEDDDDDRVVLGNGQRMSQQSYDNGAFEEQDGELVWKVVDDLRRVSGTSKSDSFEFDSRHSSLDGGALPSPTAGTSNDVLASLLRHHRRNRSSGGSMPVPSARYPSVYVRDERRLLNLGKEGGVAEGHEEEGRFFVRPKEVVDERGEEGEDARGVRLAVRDEAVV